MLKTCLMIIYCNPTVLGVRYTVVNQNVPEPLLWLKHQVQTFSRTDSSPASPSLPVATALVSIPSHIP